MPKNTNFKFKHIVNYVVVGGALILFVLLDLLGLLSRANNLLLVQIGYSIVLAVSLNLVVGFLGELSLGHAGFMCIGAFVGGLVYNALCVSTGSVAVALPVALVVGGLIAAAFGFIIGLPALRLKGDYLAIVTLAFGEIVRTVIRNQAVFGGAMGLSIDKKFGNKLYIVAFAIALLTIFVAQNLRRSKHGRAIQAIRDNEIAARAMGVNVTYYKIIVFVIAAFFAGMAGVLLSANTSLVQSSQFSFNYSIDILVMVVLGGMGSITGSILAAALLTFVEVTLMTNLPGELAALEPMIYALILILAVMWNNAPALRPVREKYNFTNLVAWIRARLHKGEEEGGTEASDIAVWDKIPTKIEMDALLSTDLTPNDAFEVDPRGKEEQK